MKRASLNPLLPSLLLLTATGCAVGPDYAAPQVALPDHFEGAAAATRPAAPVDLARWWTTFDDPLLDRLVARAVERNLDLKAAESRVREARALRGTVEAALWPTVNGAASYRRQRTSENAFDVGSGQGGGGAGQPFGAFAEPGQATDLWQAGFDAAWELDVFGGTRRAVEAAQADVGASAEAARDSLVSLTAEVARNYIELRALQREIDIAHRNVTLQLDAVEVARAKERLAGGSELEVARAQAQVAQTRAAIPAFEAERDAAAHRLAVLLAMPPRALVAELRAAGPIPTGPAAVPPGLPADLLRRRPDVRRAERELAAATARIGEAVADFFPRFSLTGSFGFQSEKVKHIADWRSRFWSVGPAIDWPIFQAGRIASNVAVQEERARQAALRYEQTVLAALGDVETALVAYEKEQARRAQLAQAVERNRRSVELANTLYKGGGRDFLNVIDAQRSLLITEDLLAQSDRAIATNLVSLYKALGGGWSDPAPAVAGAGPRSDPAR